MAKNNSCIVIRSDGRFTDWYFVHKTGVVFELEYVPRQDITIILLHAILEEHEVPDNNDDNDGVFLVDFSYGKVEYIPSQDIEYYIDEWLRKKSYTFIKAILRRQKRYAHYTAIKETANRANTEAPVNGATRPLTSTNCCTLILACCVRIALKLFAATERR